MSASDDDRIAYLAGEEVESLPAQERAELDELRALLRSPATWIEPDQGLEDRVVAAVAEAVAQSGESAAQSRQAAQQSAEAAPQSGAPAAAPGRRPRVRRWRLPSLALRPPALAFGGALAAAVVALVVALSVSGGGSQPLRFAMVVTGTPLAPGAHGSARLTKTASGWRIELRVTGLPHLDAPSFYEAWLRNDAGILVPVGTFNDARSVVLWSGVPVTKFRTLTVTRQQANGNPASSGLRVLTGTATRIH
jgi:hypothetical protein